MSIYGYSSTAGDNTTVGGNSIAEGAPAGLVNNAFRGYVADVNDWRKDFGGALTSAGSANAQTLTTNGTIAALADGLMLAFEAGAALTNTTTTATLNVDGLGAKKMRRLGDADLVAGDITAGNFYLAMYSEAADAAAGGWIIINPSKVDADTVDGIQGSAIVTNVGTQTIQGLKTFAETVKFAGATDTAPGTTNVAGTVIRDDNISHFSALATHVQVINRGDDGQLVRYHRAGTIVGSVSVTASATAFNTSSDERLKENAVPLESSISARALLADPRTTPQRYRRTDGDLGMQDGFIAQQIAQVLPQIVTPGTGEPGAPDFVPWSIDYGKASPYLWAICQQQQKTIDALEARVEALETR